jgi:hypothetical protein
LVLHSVDFLTGWQHYSEARSNIKFMKTYKNIKGGLSILGLLILVLILILVLGYFNVSVEEVVESETSQENIEYVREGGKGFWEKHLKEPASYLWNDIWVDLFWEPFVENMTSLKNGEASDLDKVPPPTVSY